MSVIKWASKYIDFKMGLLGSLVMGLMVFGVNYVETAREYGMPDLIGSTTAAIKQGVFTIFFGGAVMRFSERLSTEISNVYIAIISSSILPSTSSIILLLAIHSLKGTPEPFLSILPTAVFIYPWTAVWGIRQRQKMNKKKAA
jgi:hypothetical protein